MLPVAETIADHGIDVNAFRMIFDDSEIGFGRIKILDEVIPDVPLPDDLESGSRASWRGFSAP